MDGMGWDGMGGFDLGVVEGWDGCRVVWTRPGWFRQQEGYFMKQAADIGGKHSNGFLRTPM